MSARIPTTPPARVVAPDQRATPVTVLLIEDDEGDAFLVQELLLQAGSAIQIRWVRSLAEARDVLAAGAVRCVLLDLGLPDAEGLEALRETIALAPRAAVLVLTGLADEHRGTEAVAAGAQDYLVKGQVDGELLGRAIRYALERKRADEQVRRLYETELRAQENARLERGLLAVPLLRDPELTCVTRYRPGRHQATLGGDFYDVVQTRDGTVYAIIGDVCGHGPDEAALGVCLRIAWRTLVIAGLPARRILPTLDQVLLGERRSEEHFATACMLVVAPGRDAGWLYLAGHPAPLCIAEDGVELLSEVDSGPALGVVPGVEWTGEKLDLLGNWSLMLYTDGLIEGRVGQDGERLGVDGLLDLVRRQQADGPDPRAWPDPMLAAVEELNGGPMVDDVAVLVMSRLAAAK